jgi:hypothetical protein
VFSRPACSLLEWHPFTISSGPERSNVLTLHIRVASAKGWTSALRQMLQRREQASQAIEAGAGAVAGRSPLHRQHSVIVRRQLVAVEPGAPHMAQALTSVEGLRTDAAGGSTMELLWRVSRRNVMAWIRGEKVKPEDGTDPTRPVSSLRCSLPWAP